MGFEKETEDDIDVDDEILDEDDWGDSDSSEGSDDEDDDVIDEGVNGD